MSIGIQSNFSSVCVLGLFFLFGCVADDWSRDISGATCFMGVNRVGIEQDKVMRLGGGRDEEHLLPAQVEIYEGESVGFVSLDHRLHSLSFLVDSLSSEMVSFLSETKQLAPVPLMTQGDCLELRFNGAPSGRYSFVSRGYGGLAYGEIIVQEKNRY